MKMKRILCLILALALLTCCPVLATGDEGPTEQEVYQAIIAMKAQYPEGTRWDANTEYYRQADGGYYYACMGFAWLLSDAAFGDAKHLYCEYSYEALRVGDIVVVNTGYEGHAFVVLEKYDHGIVIAEGNYNSTVHWGRYISRETLDSVGTEPGTGFPVDYVNYVYTRYPQECYHEYEYVARHVEPCAEEGYYEYVCSLCGDVKMEEVYFFGGLHNWGEWTVVREACGYIPGLEVSYCLDCGKELSYEIVDKGNPFWDVTTDQYYYLPVLWALEKGITTGVDANHFGPGNLCTRAQAVTFLWRAAGSPEPGLKTENFEDVSSGDYFYKAVLWALENGITTGVSDTRFAPNENCTRAQIVTFMWRYDGSPKAIGQGFSDVKSGDWFAVAVAWAAAKGITTGYSDGSFGPGDNCTRGQMATFLYRYIG